jgi:hypothetical protein
VGPQYACRCTYREERSTPAGRPAVSIAVRAAGGLNDDERLCRAPAMRWVVGERAIAGFAASASEMDRFETKRLSQPENPAALDDLPGQWIDKVHRRRPPKMIVLADQPAREANQDRREGRQPWPLRHLPDGRGRGATTDVPGTPVADRPVAGTARASMRGAGTSRCDRRRERCALALPTDCFDCQARPATRDLLLAKTPEGAILASNHRESEGCPVKWWGYEE